jgi:hypothetical protein
MQIYERMFRFSKLFSNYFFDEVLKRSPDKGFRG